MTTHTQCYVFDYALRRAWHPHARFPAAAHNRQFSGDRYIRSDPVVS